MHSPIIYFKKGLTSISIISVSMFFFGIIFNGTALSRLIAGIYAFLLSILISLIFYLFWFIPIHFLLSKFKEPKTWHNYLICLLPSIIITLSITYSIIIHNGTKYSQYGLLVPSVLMGLIGAFVFSKEVKNTQ